MKTLLKPAAALMLLALSLTGCDKKTDDQPAPAAASPTESSIKATVGGVPFAAVGNLPQVAALRLSTTDPLEYPVYMLRGYEGDRQLMLRISKCTGVGTYPILANYNGTLYTSSGNYTDNIYTSPYFSSQDMPNSGTKVGEVVITSYDATAKRLQGTFYFTGSTIAKASQPAITKSVTNGTFDIKGVTL